MNQIIKNNNNEVNLSKEIFWKYMLIAQDMSGKTLLNETSKFYYESLKHLTNQQYVDAIIQVMREKKYPTLPMIGDIFDKVNHKPDIKDISRMRFTSQETFDKWNEIQNNKYELIHDGHIKLKD
tara:strand:- start:4663 stop:5034 length:372 start_codon:yes stop_codon:yes gene_type:complete